MTSKESKHWILRMITVCVAVRSSIQANPSCYPTKKEMINVHLICHTHNDVGWLKTVDQYYYGSRTTIQRAGVQYILDSVVDALQKDKNRKFIYVESAFFFRWWDQQEDHVKAIVKELVKSGQLEFISGGWCMNDEATTHYNGIIDQMTLGLMKLNETFGEAARPTIAWQIDPFGHSREQARIFRQMGFEALFIGRLDHDDKQTRWAEKTMEMLWNVSRKLEDDAWLFTGVLPDDYRPPPGFCFDILCSDDPIIDDPRLADYNVDKKVDDFLKFAMYYNEAYSTNHIQVTMGEDFHYQDANTWFKNLDKLVRYVNRRQENGSKVNVFYSTPSCYISSLHDANTTWPVKSDDFFPYASGNHSYWTGFYTSRPTFKGYVRQTNGILQATKQLASLLGIGRTEKLELLSRVVGVIQHHDAVTGTQKQHVADDYSLRMYEGISSALGIMASALRKLQPEIFARDRDNQSVNFCPLLNISSCHFTETFSTFVMTIYNPIARPVDHYVRIPVRGDNGYTITDYNGDEIKAQLVPIDRSILSLPGRESSATHDLVFLAKEIPPLGFLRFYVKKSTNRQVLETQRSTVRNLNICEDEEGFVKISRKEVRGEQNLAIFLDSKTGLLKMVGAVRHGEMKIISVSQNFFVYPAMAGNNTKESLRASGAYIFRPNATEPTKVVDKVQVVSVEGPLVYEVQQHWSPWVSQVIRSYMGQMNLEMEWMVGPIPIGDGVGREIVSRIDWTELNSGNTFYTDSNGREMIKRVKNYRPTWNLNNQEPVAGNYYPINSRIILDDGTNFKAAVLTDRSQGATSLNPGQMELMVHRRLMYDDAFGVREPLNETQYGVGLIARGKHHLLHSTFASEECDFGCLHRTLGEHLLLPPLYAFEEVTVSAQEWKSSVNMWTGLGKSLPSNVHLLTLEPWRENQVLLRLEHLYDMGESQHHSKPAKVSLKGLLLDWEIIKAEEMNLSANQRKGEAKNFKWGVKIEKINPEHNPRDPYHSVFSDDQLTITLQPMEIRTFILTVKKTFSN